MNLKIAARRVALLFLLFTLCAVTALAQTTSFTYQGRLTDGGTAANGNYDLQFALFDSVSGGAQIGATQSIPTVSVSAGIFTVPLDFGAGAFPGAPRFLEIGARLAGTGSFTTLSPRQPITSTPYAIRSLNASSADTVTVNGVPGGSGNYIQNSPGSQQAGNFNISGNGAAGGTLSGNIIDAATQYNIGGNRVFSVVGQNNTLAGINAGLATTNTNGGDNSFFGYGAGFVNTSGSNSFFGASAGGGNTIGSGNSFFGASVGARNTEGVSNAFFGYAAGFSNMKGGRNAFFGRDSGISNVDGSNNTVIGYFANVGSNNLTNATALGANAQVDQSDALVLGSIAGINNATTSVKVGIGTTRPTQKLAVETTSAGTQTLVTLNVPNAVGNNGALDFAVNNAGTIIPVAKVAAIYGAVNDIGLAFSTFNASGIAERVRIDKSGAVGIGTTSPSAMLDVAGAVRIVGLVSGDVSPLCRNNSSQIVATCNASSLRYKDNVQPLRQGLSLIQRLRPVTFSWKESGRQGLGLIAEEVAAVEPLLAEYKEGRVEGVKYERLNIILINAIKQQQEQIETLRTSNTALNARLRAVEKVLMKRVGSSRRRH